MKMVDLRAEAAEEARRLARARALFRDGDGRALVQLECDATWIATPRRSRLKRSLGARVCLVWRAAFEDASGRVIESRLVPVLVETTGDAGRVLSTSARQETQSGLRWTRHAWIRSLLTHTDGLVRARVEAECDEWAIEVARVSDAFMSARLARERDIAGPRAASSSASQPGLFDRRLERQRQARAAAAAESEQASAERLRTIAAGGAIARVPVRLLLVLVP